MSKRSGALRLAGEDLAGDRHICGLFDGPDEAAAIVWPFILEGLEQGDRVIHVVEDPDAYRARLPAGVDVTAAMLSGQLDLRAWSQSYLADGRFNCSRMLGYIRRSLREGLALGYPATRLVGDMAWAADDVPGADELVAYESGVDGILGRARDAIVCAYDVRRHSATRIAAILSQHQAMVVGGELRRSDGRGRGMTPRDRILSAASRLFSETGIRTTGVDALIEAAGVAKATFYRQFRSKDDLIVAWLKDPRTRWFDRVRAQAEMRAHSEDEIVAELFGAVAEWLEQDDFRGCPYLNLPIELMDSAHPARSVVRDYLAEIARYLQDAVAAAGYKDAARLGTELHTLLAGSISLAVALRTSGYALAAREAAAQLLANAERTSTES
jgi:AcrR family transcriptional regulator